MRNALQIALSALCAAALSGCMTMPPSTYQGSANGYNTALQKTADEQLLLNLVRLKYRDTPYFMEASSFTAQFDFNTNASIGGAFPLSGDGTDVLNAGAGVSFSERPTIAFTPLQGEDFVSRLLQPVSFQTISLLFNSGWSIDAVGRMVVQRVNGVDNAPGASGPTPKEAATYVEFNRVSALMFELQKTSMMQLGKGSSGENEGGPALYLPQSGASAEADEIRELLGLDPALNEYPVFAGTASIRQENTGEIIINTRSLLGVFYYLSQGVEAPAEHVKDGWVTRTLNADGSAFDWNQVLLDLFKVQVDSSRPSDAYVSTHYRGNWYSIPNSDLDTKASFTILSQMFALETGDAMSQTPLLTIPISN
ncbi:hypothetical protein [Puniceicoccus vermicola]|uniref:Uncharacterized protein n=1 Tax=Puniceicoccus vermicola TaxID=388746 RepID=A0A7X1E3N6_9BACT|nr:hypothetical protein [Puniceicoccus vermicola]MBC2601174.1 hypothetical protein [Puniceicoccus vermicola]